MSSRRVVVFGLGGVGKTQLVLACLNQYRDDYPDACFWLRADQATTFVSDLASLAWRLGLPEREQREQERQIEAVLRWLREHERWLLVVDNLDQPVVETMRHWLPTDLPGHLAVTSRSPQGAVRLRVEPLPLEVASDFLLRRTGKEDATGARAIAEALGGLPLALEQAAAYLIESPWHSLTDYAHLLRTRMAELLREGKPEGYPLPVAMTWEPSIQRIEQAQPPAVDLLRLCGFLAPDDIPITVLRAGREELPDPIREVLEDEIECDRAVGALRGYSLIDRNGDRLDVHRLVQWVVRESLETDGRERWLGSAIRLLRRTFPDDVDDPARWRLCARLLPHVQATFEAATDEALEPGAMSWLLDRMATYLRQRAELKMAAQYSRFALEIRERSFGPNHPETMTSVNNLGLLLHDLGELVDARTYLERALAFDEAVHGPEHPHTATSLNNLGLTLRDQGELAEAQRLYERALAIREHALGPSHPETANSLINVGLVLRAQGNLAAAKPYLERALAIRESVLAPNHPDIAHSLNSVGMLLYDQGDLEAAWPYLERALAIRETMLGSAHIDTATSLNNVGRLLRDQGRLATAKDLLERALAINEMALGPEHLNTAHCLHNLGVLLRDQGDLITARSLLGRALAVREKALGPNYIDTVTSRRALESLPPLASK